MFSRGTFATAAPLAIDAAQRQHLETLVRAGTTPQRVACRCLPHGRASAGVEALRQRAGRVCTRTVEQRIRDAPLTTRSLSGTHWSVRTPAKQLGVSRMMVQRV